MTDRFYGSLDRCHLHIRTFAPLWMTEWDGKDWAFSWWRLINPANWWYSAKQRGNWRCDFRVHRNANWRCYCPIGWAARGSLVLCGFGVIWWWHWFGGKVPCVCDEVFAQAFPEHEVEA